MSKQGFVYDKYYIKFELDNEIDWIGPYGDPMELRHQEELLRKQYPDAKIEVKHIV